MNHEISLQVAVDMTTRYRNNKTTILDPEQPADVLANCETFSKEAVLKVLNHQDCQSLRIYYGMDSGLKVHAILVGANAQGADILPTDADPAVILEDAQRCPPYCPPPSVLNDE